MNLNICSRCWGFSLQSWSGYATTGKGPQRAQCVNPKTLNNKSKLCCCESTQFNPPGQTQLHKKRTSRTTDNNWQDLTEHRQRCLLLSLCLKQQKHLCQCSFTTVRSHPHISRSADPKSLNDNITMNDSRVRGAYCLHAVYGSVQRGSGKRGGRHRGGKLKVPPSAHNRMPAADGMQLLRPWDSSLQTASKAQHCWHHRSQKAPCCFLSITGQCCARHQQGTFRLLSHTQYMLVSLALSTQPSPPQKNDNTLVCCLRLCGCECHTVVGVPHCQSHTG